MSRVAYRERETDTREYSSYDEPRRSYTTVKKYQMPDSRSALGDDDTKERVVIRTRSAQPPQRDRDREEIDIRIRESDGRGDDFRFNERINISDRDRGGDRNSSYRVTERESDSYDNDRQSRAGGNRSEYRSSDYRTSYYERDRDQAYAPDPPAQNRSTEWRFERERDYGNRDDHHSDHHHHHHGRDDYEVERYVKETDYYSPPERQPAPIIIREERPRDPPIIIRESAPQPIIIREERREPRYESYERSYEREERDESKSLVKTEQPQPSPSPQPQPQQEEDYFYERRVIERDRTPARRDDYDRHTEIRPRDSASQYSSDDSYEHVRRETTYYGSREHSPHHKRHLVEGALAGAAAGELIRHHRKSQGRDGGGHIKSGIGGAAVGALGAEAISRYRSKSRRRRSRSGSRSSSRDSRRSRRTRRRSHSRSRSRSRSKSLSRKQVVGLAGVAGLAALGGYALSKKNKKETVIIPEEGRRRSRSRRRALSAGSDLSDQAREDDRHRDPEHRNRRIAQAGLGAAAAAGIFDRVRSKSKGKRGKSKTRLQQGVPIAAAGLGGAALAGLYEKNRATKEAKRDAIVEREMTGRGRSRSRSRGYPGDRGSMSERDRDMYSYGNDTVHRGSYDDDGPGQYRRRGGSAESSPDNRHRHRSRSRGQDLAAAGAAAGAAAAAAHEIGKRHGRNSARREQEAYQDPYYNQGHPHDPYAEQPSGYLPPQQQQFNAGYQQYPGGAYFPPPPTGDNAYAYNDRGLDQHPQQQQQNQYPTYNPADWPQGGESTRGVYGESEANIGGTQHINDTFAGDTRNAPDAPSPQPPPPTDERRRGREPDNNVSAPNGSTINEEPREAQDAVTDSGLTRSPRARSTSRVRFDLDANEAHSPETTRRRSKKQQDGYNDSETTKRRHRRRKSKRDSKDPRGEELMNDKYDRPPSGTTQDEDDSDGTVDLPDRFDKHGNKIGEGSDSLQGLLGSLATKFFVKGEDGEDRDGRSGRRRHRH